MPVWGRMFCGLLAALVVAGLTTVPAHARKAPAPLPVGVQALSLRGPLTQPHIDSSLDAVRSMRLNTVRIEVTWSAFEPDAAGAVDPAMIDTLDRVVAAAQRRKLRIVPIVLSTPCWASSAPVAVRGDCSTTQQRDDASHYPPVESAQFARFTSWLAARHGARFAAIILWNEPDHLNELYWRGPDKIARYVDLVKATYAPVKQAAPKLPVLAGAFVGTDGRWLQALYDAGMRGHYDGLALHFYDLTFYALRQTRAVMRRNGDTKPAWLGETGWTSCRHRAVKENGHMCVSRTAQARFTADLVRGVRRARWVRGVLLYTLRDSTEQFGLLDSSGREKPVARALRTELRRRRPAAPRRIRLRLGTSGGGLRLLGSAPAGEVWEVRATAPRVTYKGFFRADHTGRFGVSLPAQLGTRKVRVTVRSPWYGQRVTRRR